MTVEDNGIVAVTTASASNAASPVMLPPGAGPPPDPPAASKVALPPGASAVAVPMTAVPLASGDNGGTTPMWQQEKQGSKCCFCCCDFRRAVIIINIVSILLGILGILGGYVDRELDVDQIGLETPEAEILWEDAAEDRAIYAIVSVVAAAVALFGAIRFSLWMVAVNALWIVANLVLTSLSWASLVDDVNAAQPDATDINAYPAIIVTAIVSVCFLYAHLGLMQEVRSGIMTAETYPREQYSCCCAPKK